MNEINTNVTRATRCYRELIHTYYASLFKLTVICRYYFVQSEF